MSLGQYSLAFLFLLAVLATCLLSLSSELTFTFIPGLQLRGLREPGVSWSIATGGSDGTLRELPIKKMQHNYGSLP